MSDFVQVPAHVIDILADESTKKMRDMARFYSEYFKPESPIEAALGMVLTIKAEDGCFLMLRAGTDPSQPIDAPYAYHFAIIPQAKIGKYRVDFLACTPEGNRFAIECDGHDFHERTKQQAARDKARDRNLAAIGVQVLRFTGSEIWNDVLGCVRQLEQIVTASRSRVA